MLAYATAPAPAVRHGTAAHLPPWQVYRLAGDCGLAGGCRYAAVIPFGEQLVPTVGAVLTTTEIE
jgi:hypothetical protein